MPFKQYGLQFVGSAFKGENPGNPDNFAFGEGTESIPFLQKHLNDEVIRKPITWIWKDETDIRGFATLGFNDAIGYTLDEVGIGVGSSTGSDIMATDSSAIGDKTSIDSYQVRFDIKTRRG